MNLFDLSWTRTRELIATGAPVYLPVNPVEYHGPHLSLRNDALVSLGLARDLHARLAGQHPEWPYLEASPIELGFEPCPGPGSRTMSYRVLGTLVREAARALVELGCRRVLFMTFHGQPLHAWALEEGVRELARGGGAGVSPLNLVLDELTHLDPDQYAAAFAHVEDPAERAEMMQGLALDFHAGFFETSLALHYARDSVSEVYKTLPPCPKTEPDALLSRAAGTARSLGKSKLAAELMLAARGRAWGQQRPFRGYTGRPHRATAAAGAVFARAIVDKYARTCEDVFAGRAQSPLPPMGWLRAASLGGRFGAGKRPTAAEMIQ